MSRTKAKIYFVTGVGTDVGKSYATGYLALTMAAGGRKVATQKLIQTGCEPDAVPGDIATHRRITGTGMLPEDATGETCPFRFRFPASPDLAARLEGRRIDLAAADRALDVLAERYDTVLVEGAGGLLVPIDGDYTMADYAKEREMPLIVVTGGYLGSVNHTLLTLEACRARGLAVEMLVYNTYLEAEREIAADTLHYLGGYVARHMPGCSIVVLPTLD